MTDFTIKQNDTSPVIIANLQDEEGNPVDLNGADVKFHMSDYSYREVLINDIATIEDAAEGKVSYSWKAGDTSEAGKFKAEWQVTFADDAVETFPNQDYLVIEVVKELA